MKLIYFILFLSVVSLISGCKNSPVVQEEQTIVTDCSAQNPWKNSPVSFSTKIESLNQISLLWREVLPPTSYKIYKDEQLLGETVYGTYFDNFNLEANRIYNYKVVSSGNSLHSSNNYTAHLTGYIENSDVTKRVFTMNLQEDCKVRFYLGGDSSLNLYSFPGLKTVKLYNSEGNLIPTIFNVTGNHVAYSTSSMAELQKGTYYWEVQKISGQGNFEAMYYAVGTQYYEKFRDNISFEKAGLLLADSSFQGHLGYFDTTGTMNEKDFYKFTLDKKSNVSFDINADGSLVLAGGAEKGVTIYQVNGTTIMQQFDGPSGEENLRTTKNFNLLAGTYYAVIKRYEGYGGYSLKICTK